jgi:predicted phosphodiesterase
MLVAALSDVHSNPFALAAVLHDVELAGAERIWFAGDAFGYHPWAAETFALLEPVVELGVLGNHDSWVIDPQSPPAGIAPKIAMQNAAQLRTQRPAALTWLRSLPEVLRQEREGWKLTITHGTPPSPLEGRYYPDDGDPHPWLPQPGEILLLGQTHHPLLRGTASEGLLLNPGSVGQPRDGDPRPSWALIDLASGEAQLRRTAYDLDAVITALRALDWDARVITALGKRRRITPAAPVSSPPEDAFIHQ